MALGKQHDQATLFWFIPFGVLIAILFDLESGVWGGSSFLIGGLWLSPDLDTCSNAQKRWSLLKFIWFPYRKILPHRSIFSHGPILGTIGRLMYITLIISLISILLNELNLDKFEKIAKALINISLENPHQTIAIFLGLEANVWLHLIQDGDPMPIELKKWKSKMK